ncbi:diguanylate cyclase [Vibrio pelagius]|uniref:sensor domain-containing diguanylate cyclase n=1 Tax=Vibrio pelagius TaxID=28169 RepID=UPI003B831725
MARWGGTRIRTKFVITYSVLTVFFVILLFFAFYITERQRLIDNAIKYSNRISTLYSDVINQELFRHVALMQLLSKRQAFQQGHLDSIVSELIWLKKNSKNSVVNTLYIDDQWNRIDYKGTELKITRPNIIQDIRWQNANYHVSPPLHGGVVNMPVVVLGVPIHDSNLQWKGIIAVSISLRYLTERLSTVSIGNNRYAWISDINGGIIAHPDFSKVMTVNLYDTEKLDYLGLVDIIEKTKQASTGYGYYYETASNEKKHLTFSRLNVVPNWTVFVTGNESDLVLNIEQVIENIAITLFIVVSVFMPAIVYLCHAVTRPISELTKKVNDALGGGYHNFVGIRSTDEIGQLSDAFKTVITEISQQNANLEKAVSKRTEELTWLAMHDPMTKLFNRRALIEATEKEISRVIRHQLAMSLVILDIDHFKTVNDTYGHDIGDSVLIRFAQFLQSNSRKENLVARWGGEEFVIVVVEGELEDAKEFASQLLDDITKVDFSPVPNVTFSAGVASYKPNELLADLVARADKALYLAKNSGRQCVETEEHVGASQSTFALNRY